MEMWWEAAAPSCRFLMSCVEQMEGGEVFVPKIPSTKVIDLANAIVPDAKVNIIGIRPGEKVHEVLISEDEARNTVEREHMFIVKPPETLWERGLQYEGKSLPEGFRYSSDTNSQWLDVDGIREFVAPFEQLFA